MISLYAKHLGQHELTLGLGLGVLFGKLQQGVQENQQVLAIARMRADAEDIYGQKLNEILPATDRITGGFSRDDGASTRKVCPIFFFPNQYQY